MPSLRIGIVGAARIAPAAVVAPARDLAGVDVVGVAARDAARARAFATEHGIPEVFESYDALLASPDVDAVYVPLPNAYHGRYTLAAARAGKHVLCEKPFAANADEAAAIDAATAGGTVVVMEGMHYRYHPLTQRLLELVRDRAVGELRAVHARMIAVVPKLADQRFQYPLAGGATMDVGCYVIHQLRSVAGGEPTVTAANAKLSSPQIDRWMHAELTFPDGVVGRFTCALLAAAPPVADLVVHGSAGSLAVLFPTRPQLVGRIFLRRRGRPSVERVPSTGSTFRYQLESFAAAVRGGPLPLTPVADAVANLRVIDAVYASAGLARREPAV
jgi:predicted dehydrogenase